MPLSQILLLSIGINLILLWVVGAELYAIYQRATQRRQHRYSRRCAHFNSAPATPNDIIFLGDSITEGCDWPALFPRQVYPNLRVRNFGIGSDTSGGVLARLSPVFAHSPRAIFLLIGTNDIGKELPEAQTAANYRAIFETIHRQAPDTTLYVQSLMPRRADEEERVQRLNALLQGLTDEYEAVYVDLFSHFADESGGIDPQYSNDNLHLLGQGYRLWQTLLTPHVKALADSAESPV